MELLGTLKLVRAEQVVSASFKKREFVVTTEEQYPQDIQVEFTQDKCDLLNSYKVGDKVKVGINLRGREWTNKQGEKVYFNTIQAWNIFKQDGNNTPKTESMPSFAPAPDFSNSDEPDDLPF